MLHHSAIDSDLTDIYFSENLRDYISNVCTPYSILHIGYCNLQTGTYQAQINQHRNHKSQSLACSQCNMIVRTASLFCGRAWIDGCGISSIFPAAEVVLLLDKPKTFISFWKSWHLKPWPQQPKAKVFQETVLLVRSSCFPNWKFAQENYFLRA